MGFFWDTYFPEPADASSIPNTHTHVGTTTAPFSDAVVESAHKTFGFGECGELEYRITAEVMATADTCQSIGSSPLESPLTAYKDNKIAQIASLTIERQVALRMHMGVVIWPHAWNSLATLEDVLQNNISFTDWTAEENELLTSLKSDWDLTWAELSTHIFIGRRMDHCEQRYIKIAGFHLDTIFPTESSASLYTWSDEDLIKIAEGRERNMSDAQIAAMFPQHDFTASDIETTVKQRAVDIENLIAKRKRQE